MSASIMGGPILRGLVPFSPQAVNGSTTPALDGFMFTQMVPVVIGFGMPSTIIGGGARKVYILIFCCKRRHLNGTILILVKALYGLMILILKNG